MTRELDLNNPMGIRISEDVFQGELESTDPDFKRFASLVEGVRAGAKILLTYYNDYKLNTVVGIISRWSPAVENDVLSYVRDVCQHVGVQAAEPLDLTSPSVLASLVTAIIHHENGVGIDPAIVVQAVGLVL